MTKAELQKLIREEVKRQMAELVPEIIKEVVTPSLVKKMIAEAFQGVLETKPSKQPIKESRIARPNIPQAGSPRKKINPSDIGYGDEFGGILSETVGFDESTAPSILDHANNVPDELSEVFTRDYSALVKAMSKK